MLVRSRRSTRAGLARPGVTAAARASSSC